MFFENICLQETCESGGENDGINCLAQREVKTCYFKVQNLFYVHKKKSLDFTFS